MSRARSRLDAFVASAGIYAGTGIGVSILFFAIQDVLYEGVVSQGVDVEGVLYTGLYVFTGRVPPALAFGLVTSSVPRWRELPRAWFGAIPVSAALIDLFFLQVPFGNDLDLWIYQTLEAVWSTSWPGMALGVGAVGVAYIVPRREASPPVAGSADTTEIP